MRSRKIEVVEQIGHHGGRFWTLQWITLSEIANITNWRESIYFFYLLETISAIFEILNFFRCVWNQLLTETNTTILPPIEKMQPEWKRAAYFKTNYLKFPRLNKPNRTYAFLLLANNAVKITSMIKKPTKRSLWVWKLHTLHVAFA